MDESKYQMVSYLNEPERILIFTMDEFLLFILPVICGLVMHHGLIGIFIGIGLVFSLNKLRGGGDDSLMQRFLYWYFPSKITALKHTPPSFIRQLIG